MSSLRTDRVAFADWNSFSKEAGSAGSSSFAITEFASNLPSALAAAVFSGATLSAHASFAAREVDLAVLATLEMTSALVEEGRALPRIANVNPEPIPKQSTPKTDNTSVE
jgi:hypothetical protein